MTNNRCYYCNRLIKKANSTICLKCKAIKKGIRNLDLNAYFCLNCHIIHKTKIGITSKVFVRHFKYRNSNEKLSETFIRNYKFSNSWNNYDINSHKKRVGSSKQ